MWFLIFKNVYFGFGDKLYPVYINPAKCECLKVSNEPHIYIKKEIIYCYKIGIKQETYFNFLLKTPITSTYRDYLDTRATIFLPSVF